MATAPGSTCCAPLVPAGRRPSPSASTRQESADKIVEIVKAEFPLAKLLVRSFDRGHSIRLIGAGVDYQIRETFESAMNFGAGSARLARGAGGRGGRDDRRRPRARRRTLRHPAHRRHLCRPRPDVEVAGTDPDPAVAAEARRPAAQRRDRGGGGRNGRRKTSRPSSRSGDYRPVRQSSLRAMCRTRMTSIPKRALTGR